MRKDTNLGKENSNHRRKDKNLGRKASIPRSKNSNLRRTETNLGMKGIQNWEGLGRKDTKTLEGRMKPWEERIKPRKERYRISKLMR